MARVLTWRVINLVVTLKCLKSPAKLLHTVTLLPCQCHSLGRTSKETTSYPGHSERHSTYVADQSGFLSLKTFGHGSYDDNVAKKVPDANNRD